MASEQKLELLVKVNQDTGGLDVVAGKFKATSEAAQKATGIFDGLSSSAKLLGSAIVGAFTVRSIASFVQDSIRAAEQEDQALRRLRFSVESLGGSWDQNRRKVMEWAAELQKTTRFSDGEAYSALDRLTRVTGDLKQAQTATVVAMNMSVASGKDLSEMEELLASLILGREKALKRANMEFGAFLAGAKNAQQALDILTQKFQGVAQHEESLTKNINRLSNSFGDFKENFSRFMNPVFDFWIDKANKTVEFTNKIWESVNRFESRLSDAPSRGGGASGSWDKETKAVDAAAKEQTRIIAHKTLEQTKLEEDALQKRLENFIEHEQARAQIYREYNDQEIEILKITNEEHVKQMEHMKKMAEKVGVEIAQNFSSAFADTILGAQNFQQAMEGVFMNIQRAIVEAITQMIIFRAIATAIGGPFGGFMPFKMGAAGSPTMPRGMTPPNPLSQNPSTVRILNAMVRNTEQYRTRPLGY